MQQLLAALPIIYICGAFLTVIGFVTFTFWDRHANGTPWNWFTVTSRILMLFLLWPIFLPLACVFLLPELLRSRSGPPNP